ncbi:Predicted fumarylacetoacetate hydralase [Ceraceosorus bombacis]|uniref:Predicted fumarylacetoacetate hydralase n=1 Tax=Ceraceosorus bombacis TaxID=401625 RepID=A0A0P1BE36_9BASI|nr:Predicted fumarylacetoacetate hydralase [Ceraceosorus bombacis]
MTWHRLVRFVAKEDGKAYVGVPRVSSSSQDIEQLVRTGQERVRVKVIAAAAGADEWNIEKILSAARDAGDAGGEEEKTVDRLLPCVPAERIPALRALGANYVQAGQDAAQAKANRPAIPILFFKPPRTTVVGPGDAIRVPEQLADQTDYEVELVVIIGAKCKDVKKEHALDYVLGYTLGNDVSARKRMFQVPQWGLGKAADTFFPLSSTIVSKELIRNPEDVTLKTHLNGKEMQNGNTRHHLWSVAETIEMLSQGTTLLPGDLISMCVAVAVAAWAHTR